MSVIGGLLMPQFKPYDLGATLQQANQIQGGRTSNETALIKLAELKQSQASEAEVMAAIQRDPSLQALLFGGGMPQSTLGSLGAAPGGPGAGPLTQTTTVPGQPSITQQIPGGQDLSRFANVPPQGGGPISPNVMGQVLPTVTPPQSTIASLGQPQGPMQGPQNPVLEMARRDPRAALALQQQIEGRQDAAMKRQEQQLTMGTKVMEYLGRGAQGVSDQASLDAFRQEVARVHPQAAASLPQTYSKEAMAPFIAKALDVKEALTLQVQDLTAQAAVIKARKEGRSVDVDNQLRAMGVQPGQETPEQIKEALRLVQEGKIAVSASHGQGQLRDSPLGVVRVGKDDKVEYVRGPNGEILQAKPTEAEQRAASFGNRAQAAHENAVALEDKGLTPGIWSKVGEALPFGLGNYLVGEDQQRYRQAVSQFAQALLRKESGAAISLTEYTMTETTYFPQPGNSKKVIEDKRRERERIIKEMQEEGRGTGRTGRQGQPTSQGTGKPVGQMNAEETRAEIAAIKARGGR